MDQSICFGRNHSSDSKDHVSYPSSKGVLARESSSAQFHAVVLQNEVMDDTLPNKSRKRFYKL
jgi:hypothetical protein